MGVDNMVRGIFGRNYITYHKYTANFLTQNDRKNITIIIILILCIVLKTIVPSMISRRWSLTQVAPNIGKLRKTINVKYHV